MRNNKEASLEDFLENLTNIIVSNNIVFIFEISLGTKFRFEFPAPSGLLYMVKALHKIRGKFDYFVAPSFNKELSPLAFF